MSDQVEPHCGPYVTKRHDEPYTGRKRLMIKRAARIKHPVTSSLVALTLLVLGTISGFITPIVNPYFTEAIRICLLVAVVTLGCAMLCKHEAVFRRSLGLSHLPYIRYYIGMWLALGLAFYLFGLSLGNWLIRL